MADWATIASLATAGGTLVLAVATFSSVRSANRSSRLAEQALLANIRPLLLGSRREDPPEKVMWADEHWARVPGGEGIAEFDGDVVWIAASLRNAGTGLALLHGWYPLITAEEIAADPVETERFHRLTRDLYIAPGDTGFWQGAIRDTDDPDLERVRTAIKERRRIVVDVLYGDQEGGQRTVTRLGLMPVAEDRWLVSALRHWYLDRPDPR